MIAEAKVLQAVETRLDEIVQLAEECVTKTGVVRTDIEESQFRNLQNLATTTDSIAVLENFVAYQVGRRRINDRVGRQILEDFQKLNNMAREICQNWGLGKELIARVRAELVRLYLGFLTRKFVAEKKKGE